MIVSYDSDWQFPAITEKHAFHKAAELLGTYQQTVYVGFPWATLIDLSNNNKLNADRLLGELDRLAPQLSGFGRCVTVCQHIHLGRYEHFFHRLGITDVFWAHAQKGESRFSQYPDIRIHPFPLYPVNYSAAHKDFRDRKFLFSFIGARANSWYLTDSRDLILDLLGPDNRGLVKGREAWHFNRIVYDHQIHNHADLDAQQLIDESAASEFSAVLADSVFALCPSGSGPNSIRLWEALGSGTIPVILSDSYLPPGNPDLWEAACVFCGENARDIEQLPGQLERLFEDMETMVMKRDACQQLWSLYGPDCFVCDVAALFLELEQNAYAQAGGQSRDQYELLSYFSSQLAAKGKLDQREARLFILSFVSNVLLDPERSREYLATDASLGPALQAAMSACPDAANLNARNVLQSLQFDFA